MGEDEEKEKFDEQIKRYPRSDDDIVSSRRRKNLMRSNQVVKSLRARDIPVSEIAVIVNSFSKATTRSGSYNFSLPQSTQCQRTFPAHGSNRPSEISNGQKDICSLPSIAFFSCPSPLPTLSFPSFCRIMSCLIMDLTFCRHVCRSFEQEMLQTLSMLCRVRTHGIAASSGRRCLDDELRRREPGERRRRIEEFRV
eukprot:749931-Hanusia_phi.AAC.1